MQETLNTTIPPFDLLTEVQINRIQTSLTIEYFESGQSIIAAGSEPNGLFIIIKGQVEEYDDSIDGDLDARRVAQYSEGDLFGSLAILKGQAKDHYVAFEETLCHVLPASVFLDLVRENPAFRHFFP